MSDMGQSLRFDAPAGHFRSSPISGHHASRPARPKRASFGLMLRTKTGQCSITASARVRVGSFGQPRFPKTLNQLLRVCLPAPRDER